MTSKPSAKHSPKTNEKYQADVKVDIYIDSKDTFIENEGDASITYNLDIEYRKYGIHGILPILSGDTTVSYTETTEDAEKEVDKEIITKLIKNGFGDSYSAVIRRLLREAKNK